jgi:hypothetical protein
VFSADDLRMMRELLNKLEPEKSISSKKKQNKHNKNGNDGNDGNNGNDGKNGKNALALSPPQLLIIAALLSGALNVESLLIDHNQNIKVILTGTLKRKTQLEQVMSQIGQLQFDQVIRAIMQNNM